MVFHPYVKDGRETYINIAVIPPLVRNIGQRQNG